MKSRLAPIALLTIALGAAILLRFYSGGSGRVGEPTPGERARASHDVERVAEAADAAGAVKTDEDTGGDAPQALDDVSPTTASALEVFLDVRGIPLAGHVTQDLRDFVAQPRDPWSAGMEAQFQSALTQSTLNVFESYVECRRSLCFVLFVHLPETQTLDQLRRASIAEHQRLLSTIGLYGSGVSLLRAQSGVLVEWHRFHRRCGPDWHCLE